MIENTTPPIWCAYLPAGEQGADPTRELATIARRRTSMMVRTRRRTEVYARGPIPPLLENRHDQGRVRLLTRTAESVHRLTGIAAGLDSPLLGDPLIIEQLTDRLTALSALHPLRATLAEALRDARRLRRTHGLDHGRGYPHLAVDVLTHDADAAGRCLVVRGAGRLGRAAAAAGVQARYDRVYLVTRSPRSARTALRTGPYAAVIDIRSPRTDFVPGPGWDLIVATDDTDHHPVTTAPGCRRAVDLSTPGRHCRPDADTVHALHGPALSVRIQAHNGGLARRGARARLELARSFAEHTTAED
ncbi:hypothetical protein ACWEKT_26865 [Nocardia takedensis]